MQAEPVIIPNNRQQVKDALTLGFKGKKRITIWGYSFIPKTFDYCVIASSLDAAYSVYKDAVGEACVDPEKGTVVRFIRLRQADEKPVANQEFKTAA